MKGNCRLHSGLKPPQTKNFWKVGLHIMQFYFMLILICLTMAQTIYCNITVFQSVTSCSLVHWCQHFRRIYCLHSSLLEKNVAGSFEKLITLSKTYLRVRHRQTVMQIFTSSFKRDSGLYILYSTCDGNQSHLREISPRTHVTLLWHTFRCFRHTLCICQTAQLHISEESTLNDHHNGNIKTPIIFLLFHDCHF
jgi:hypothetical protein